MFLFMARLLSNDSTESKRALPVVEKMSPPIHLFLITVSDRSQ